MTASYYIVSRILSGMLILLSLCVLGCTPVAHEDDRNEHDEISEERQVPEGMKRLYLRIHADVEIYDVLSLDLTEKTVNVNGQDYIPNYSATRKLWYVDVEESTFHTYTGTLLQTGSEHWYNTSAISDILIPSIQFSHKFKDFDQIPLVGEHDPSMGDFIDFYPPYSVLDFDITGMDDLSSIRLVSSDAVAGTASWNRSKRKFTYQGTCNEIVLNCTQSQNNGRYSIIVVGTRMSSVTMRLCSRKHRSVEIVLDDMDLYPGEVFSRNLHVIPDPAQYWFEGFDLCTWGGDIIAQKQGFAPSSTQQGPDGDESLSGYEYALTPVPYNFSGSGYIQKSFYQGQSSVLQSHGMSDSYVSSRGFTDNRYMLRCREYNGYISVGTDDRNRGWFALYPLEGCGLNTISNLDIRFRICMDNSCDDDILFLINGSEDAITQWYVDDMAGPMSVVSHYGTADTLRLSSDILGKGQWRNIRVFADNCTGLTALHWLGASSEDGSHGFYLDEISVCERSDSWNKSNDKIRIMSWNIQNGMWADQPDYDNFVRFVKKYEPDICVWCEARTNHQTGSDESLDGQPYLPDNWNKLASRYGHSHVAISRRGTERFPQVVTSRYPVEKLLQIGDMSDGNSVLHGAGVFSVKSDLGDIRLLTVHLRPNPSNGTNVDGDNLRLYEITKILDATVNSSTFGGTPNWIVLGDFNADSRRDSHVYNLPDNGTRYRVHDYIAENTSLIDVMWTRYPHCFMYTTASSRRIDYVYMDEQSYGRITDACVLTDDWTEPEKTSIANFCKPSDHRPILIDMQY